MSYYEEAKQEIKTLLKAANFKMTEGERGLWKDRLSRAVVRADELSPV